MPFCRWQASTYFAAGTLLPHQVWLPRFNLQLWSIWQRGRPIGLILPHCRCSTSCSCKRVQGPPVHRDCILVADLILTSIHWEAEGWIHLAGRPARGTGLQIRFIFLARSPFLTPTLAQASLPPSSSTYSMSSKSHVTTGSRRNDFPNKFYQEFLFQAVLAGHFGSLSRISFHYPATFIYFDTVMTVCRFLRTKKNIKKYKFKQEEVIARVVEGKSSDRRESNSTDDQPFLSYGTV